MADVSERSPVVLVLGGARSGKSHYAEALLSRHSAVTYIATAGPPRDAEMESRIALHRARRPSGWRTVDAERALGQALTEAAGPVLVDCLTLWLSNAMLAEADLAAETDALLESLAARRAPTVLVANEVGQGIVPATPLGRAFRDAQGVLNRKVAGHASDVILIVAGCPLRIKPAPTPEIRL